MILDKKRIINEILDDFIITKNEKVANDKIKQLLINETAGSCRLYKYCDINLHTIDSLLNNTLWCSKPSDFNDPFECSFSINYSSLFNELTRNEMDLIEKYFVMVINYKDKKIKKENLSRNDKTIVNRIIHNNKINKFLDARFDDEASAKEYVFDNIDIVIEFIEILLSNKGIKAILQKTKEYIPEIKANINDKGRYIFNEHFNNKKEITSKYGIDEEGDEIKNTSLILKYLKPEESKNIEISETRINSLVKTIRDMMNECFKIGCLTTKNDNKLMWSHYANSHAGICIEYDFSNVIASVPILPVIYDDKKPDMFWPRKEKEPSQEDKKKLLFALITKDEIWSYENEWRILLGKNDNNKYFMPKISCIYLGTKCSEENKRIIINTVKDKNIPIRQMKLDRGEYKLYSESMRYNDIL